MPHRRLSFAFAVSGLCVPGCSLVLQEGENPCPAGLALEDDGRCHGASSVVDPALLPPLLPPLRLGEALLIEDRDGGEPAPPAQGEPLLPVIAVRDFDGDGIEDRADGCPFDVDSGADADADGIDDVCDRGYAAVVFFDNFADPALPLWTRVAGSTTWRAEAGGLVQDQGGFQSLAANLVLAADDRIVTDVRFRVQSELRDPATVGIVASGTATAGAACERGDVILSPRSQTLAIREVFDDLSTSPREWISPYRAENGLFATTQRLVSDRGPDRLGCSNENAATRSCTHDACDGLVTVPALRTRDAVTVFEGIVMYRRD